MSSVISVQDLGKQYRLGSVGTGTLGDDLNRFWHKIRGKDDPFLTVGDENDRTSKVFSNYVWALKDINFEVEHGEVLGVIGRNGAGKSTLLKILSRTTIPTTGNVKVKGRIASLLEVGTGFHPELSGKENIFLNGAILGMRKAEIKAKFDEIVDFAGVERYIDTPVKRYSSGMYVRLAFAVAANLESEILIVDEVLAVGDSEFQNKCLKKMNDVSKGEGRTVIFVSHNMQSILQLCTAGIVLSNGGLVFQGNTMDSLNFYQKNIRNKTGTVWVNESSENKIVKGIEIELKGNQPKYSLIVKCSIDRMEGLKPAFIAIEISNNVNVVMQAIPTVSAFIDFKAVKEYVFDVELVGLIPDMYNVSIWLGPHNTETYVDLVEIVSFEILDSPTVGRTFEHSRNHGFMVPESRIL